MIPRERLDTQTPEVAEAVSYAMTFINSRLTKVGKGINM